MSTSLQNLEASLNFDEKQTSLQAVEMKLAPLEIDPSLQSIEQDLDLSDYYDKKFKAIVDAPSEVVKRTKDLFDTGHPILGTLSVLEYPFANIFEAVNQFIGEPLARQAKGFEQLSGLTDLYSAPSADSINAVVEIFGPTGLAKQGIKAGLTIAGIDPFKRIDKQVDIDYSKRISDKDDVAFLALKEQQPIEGELRKAVSVSDMHKKVKETKELLRKLQGQADEDLKSNIKAQVKKGKGRAIDFAEQPLKRLPHFDVPGLLQTEKGVYIRAESLADYAIAKGLKSPTLDKLTSEIEEKLWPSLPSRPMSKKLISLEEQLKVVNKNLESAENLKQQRKFEKEKDDIVEKMLLDLRDSNDPIVESISKSTKHRSVFYQRGKDALDWIYRGSASYLDELGEFSLTAKNLRNMLKTPIVTQTLVGPDYMEAIRLQKGNFELRLADILEDKANNIKLFSGKLPEELNEAVSSAIRDPSLPLKGKDISNVKKVVTEIKTLLRDVGVYGKRSGLDINLSNTNYFPRRYKINDDPSLIPAFEDLLRSKGKSQKRIDDIIYNIQNNNGFPLIGRTIDDITDIELAPFLDNNLSSVLYKYIDTVTNTAEFTRMFGNKTDIETTKQIIKDEAKANGYNKVVSKDQFNKEIHRIDDILSAFKHQYKPIQTKTWEAVNNNITTYQYLRTLDKATISNLSEAFLNVYHSGLGKTLYTTLVPGINHILHQSIRIMFKDFPKAKITKELEELTGVLSQHETDILKEAFGTSSRIGTIGFKATGLTSLTNFNKTISARLGERYITSRVEHLAKNLQKNGMDYLNTKDAKRKLEQLQQFGIDGKDLVTGLLTKGNLDDYKQQINLGKLRYMDQIVFSPQAGNRPMRFSDPHWKLQIQLASFPVLFNNHIFPRIRADILKKYKTDKPEAIRNALKFAETVAIMSGVGYLAVNIKGMTKYGFEEWEKRQKEKTDKQKLFEAINQSGWFGQFSPLTGSLLGTKYGEDWTSSFIGPAANQAIDIGNAAFRSFDKGSLDPLADPLTKMIPVISTTPQLQKPLEEDLKQFLP